MVLHGLCTYRLKHAIRKIDSKRCHCNEPVILEAYFMDNPKEIRNHFGIKKPKKNIQEDLNSISETLSRYMQKELSFEFNKDRGGLCLLYYPKGK